MEKAPQQKCAGEEKTFCIPSAGARRGMDGDGGAALKHGRGAEETEEATESTVFQPETGAELVFEFHGGWGAGGDSFMKPSRSFAQ